MAEERPPPPTDSTTGRTAPPPLRSPIASRMSSTTTTTAEVGRELFFTTTCRHNLLGILNKNVVSLVQERHLDDQYRLDGYQGYQVDLVCCPLSRQTYSAKRNLQNSLL